MVSMKKNMGILTLIPTPLDDESPLEPIAFELLKNASENTFQSSIIVVEDHKPCRRRWIHWGLPRNAIDSFLCLNEHTTKEQTQHLLNELKSGKNIFLMSDGGLPAFCDPGRELVSLCHEHKIKVTSTPFCNSFSLAIALSGLEHKCFEFHGFLPKPGNDRNLYLKQLLKSEKTIVTNDTPYRLKSLLEELKPLSSQNHIFFLGLDLNMPTEELLRGSLPQIISQLTDFKREFVLVISQINPD